MNVFLIILNPVLDPCIDHINHEMASWMHANFTEKKLVPELGNARSYAWRLRDYNGVDQVAGIIKKLKGKPETKSATITTLLPNDDTTYIPCVSMLDFKIRDYHLVLTATCRSLDFKDKALYNLVELTRIGKEIQEACGIEGFKLHVHVISAHISESRDDANE